MSLRISLVLVTIVALGSIGVTWFLENPPGAASKTDLPFFYTLDPDDIRKIEVRTRDASEAFLLHPEEHIWYFEDPPDTPVDTDRFGGMTFLLGGPRVVRALQDQIKDESQFGLRDPSVTVTLTLRDQTAVSFDLGDLTPDQGSSYARRVGSPRLWLIDASWGKVLSRLADEPPLPKWRYTLKTENVDELLFFIDNDIVRGIAHQEDKGWVECNLPIGSGTPCDGDTPVNEAALDRYLQIIADPKFIGVAQAARNLDEVNPDLYGLGVNAPYVDIRVAEQTKPKVTVVTHVTLTLGDLTPDGTKMYVRAMEQPDVAMVDAAWGQKVRQLFDDPAIIKGG